MTKLMTCFYFNNTKTGLELRPSLYFNASNHVAYTWTTNNTKTDVVWRPSLYLNASNHVVYTWNHKQSKDGYLDKTVFGIYILKSRGCHVKVLTKTKTVSPEHRLYKDGFCLTTVFVSYPRATTATCLRRVAANIVVLMPLITNMPPVHLLRWFFETVVEFLT